MRESRPHGHPGVHGDESPDGINAVPTGLRTLGGAVHNPVALQNGGILRVWARFTTPWHDISRNVHHAIGARFISPFSAIQPVGGQ